MSGSITIYPYDPFPIENGLTLINLQNKIEYSQLLFRLNKLKNHDTLTDDEDRIVHFYTNPDNPIEEKLKDVAFIGDLTTFDINSTSNIKLVLQKVIQNSTIRKERIEELNTQLNSLVFDALSDFSSLLSFDMYANFEKLLKAKEVRLDTHTWASYCDKIMDVVNFYSEFTTKNLLLFHDFERLLSLEQLNELNDYLKSINLMVISLESYPLTLKEADLNVKVYSIDEDHVRFDY